jgi:hypothetical protein
VRKSTWIIALAAAGLAAALLWGYRNAEVAPSDPANGKAGASRSVAGSTGPDAGTRPRAGSPQADLSREPPLSAYLSAMSLRRFVEQNLQRALAGDGEAAYAVYLALEECSFLAHDELPAWLAEDPRANAKIVARRTAYDNRVARCDGVHQVKDIWKMPREMLNVAARAGQAPAIAVDLSTSDVWDPQVEVRARDLIPRLDARSLDAFSKYVGIHNNGPVLQDPPVTYDYQVYQAAWNLAACDMGLDCGHSSRLLEGLCIYEDRCGAEDYRAYLRDAMPPQNLVAATLLHDRILAALRSNDAAFFGLGPAR